MTDAKKKPNRRRNCGTPLQFTQNQTVRGIAERAVLGYKITGYKKYLDAAKKNISTRPFETTGENLCLSAPGLEMPCKYVAYTKLCPAANLIWTLVIFTPKA